MIIFHNLLSNFSFENTLLFCWIQLEWLCPPPFKIFSWEKLKKGEKMPPKRPPEKWKPFRKGKTFGIFLEYFWIGGEKKRPKIGSADYFDFLLVLSLFCWLRYASGVPFSCPIKWDTRNRREIVFSRKRPQNNVLTKIWTSLKVSYSLRPLKIVSSSYNSLHADSFIH